MKSRKTAILFLLILSLFVTNAFPQDISTEGTDFWVSFLGNGYKSNNYGGEAYLKTQVLISSLHNCTGVISNPNTGWTEPFTIEANNINIIDIPEEEAYMECDDYTTALNKSLHIVTDHPVSVYCANAARYSFDASYVLPTPALADDYLIQTYDQSHSSGEYTSAFLIIAVEEGETTVDITPTVNTLDNKPANQQYSITLQQGQVYQVRSQKTGDSRDLSGSRVTANDCKKIAVFNGNTLTKVPTDGNDADCIFEQSMPLQAWGKQFVVTASLGRQQKDYLKITSASDNNEITINGQYFVTLSANESKSFPMTESSCFIEASNRCAVYLYNHSVDGIPGYNNSKGAPSMVWIAPIEQRINELAFNTFNDETPGHVNVDQHYVNIIVESDATDHVILDGQQIPESQFNTVIGNNRYKYYRQEINHGAHHLLCEDGFNAHVYGFGNATGYAYMVGSKAADLSTIITVNGQTVAPGDTINNCDADGLTFNAIVNYDYNELQWDFGDGTSSNLNTITHPYTQEGFYQVTLTIVTQGSTSCQNSNSNTSIFYISEGSINVDPKIVDTCDYFDWHGNHYPESGHYTDTITNESGCKNVFHLYLDLIHTPTPVISCSTPNAIVFGDTIAVVTNTEFFSFQYDFYVEDSLGHIDEWEACKWHIDKPSWIIDTTIVGDLNKRYCRVYVAEHCDSVVKLSAEISNICDTKTVVFNLKSSFFDLDEQFMAQPDFNIIPNPNNGEMKLYFENLTGKVSVKVYDMYGIPIDNIEAYNELKSNNLYITLTNISSGIYLFVATAKEGTIAKKVIIE